MSPTLLNVCVVLWLNSIHSALPALVKQRYATELKNKSLASIREEISESLDALLAELSGLYIFCFGLYPSAGIFI